MAVKEGEKSLNADLPEALLDDLDVTATGFPLLSKKHLVGAALTGFMEMNKAQQQEMILLMEKRYYQTAATTEDAGSTAVGVPEKRKPPIKRRRASQKRRPGRTKRG